MPSNQLFKNDASSSLVASINAADTSCVLSQACTPPFASGKFFKATLVGYDINGRENIWEIVKVTAWSGANLTTIERGQEGTIARNWPLGSTVALRVTAETLEGFTNAAPVQSVAGRTGDVVLTPTDVALGNVENKSSATIRGEISAQNVTTALGFTPLSAAEKGAVNGVAPLGADGKVASAYLPSYVDDILEYANVQAFPAPGETGKIYIALDTNIQYRWSGSAYVQLVSSPGSTDALPEGSVNLYFTNARARSAMHQAKGSIAAAATLNLAALAEDYAYLTGSATVTAITCNDSVNKTLFPKGDVTFASSSSVMVAGGMTVTAHDGDIVECWGVGINTAIVRVTSVIGQGLTVAGIANMTQLDWGSYIQQPSNQIIFMTLLSNYSSSLCASSAAMTRVANNTTSMGLFKDSLAAMSAAVLSQTALDAINAAGAAWDTFISSTMLSAATLPLMTGYTTGNTTISASNELWSAWRIHDGIVGVSGNGWMTAPTATSALPQHLTVDTSTPTFVHTFKIYPSYNASYLWGARNCRFQVSLDNVNWATVVTFELALNSGWQTFKVVLAGKYRYKRVIVDSRWGTADGAGIDEIEINGFY